MQLDLVHCRYYFGYFQDTLKMLGAAVADADRLDLSWVLFVDTFHELPSFDVVPTCL
jgi:hypothetical protein